MRVLKVDKSLTSNYNGGMKTRDAISLTARIREKVNRMIEMELSRAGVTGVVTSHGDILYALMRQGNLTMAEIARQIGRDKSTVTALVDKLVKLGYVMKEKGNDDSRMVHVTLTEKGLALEPVFEEISQKVLRVFYNGITEQEKELLVGLLTRIHDNL